MTSRKLHLCLALGILGLLVFATSAFARATPIKFPISNPINGVEADFVCQPAPTGIVTGTDTVLFTLVPTPQGFHYSATSTQDYRIDFADGSYLISSSPTHFEGNQTRNSPSVYTEVQQDRGTLYTQDGQVIGIVSVSSVTHYTWRDSNGNGFPDPGEFITADVSTFRVSCP
jgi:hypothetical protein